MHFATAGGTALSRPSLVIAAECKPNTNDTAVVLPAARTQKVMTRSRESNSDVTFTEWFSRPGVSSIRT